jgi:hypothetical protein
VIAKNDKRVKIATVGLAAVLDSRTRGGPKLSSLKIIEIFEHRWLWFLTEYSLSQAARWPAGGLARGDHT